MISISKGEKAFFLYFGHASSRPGYHWEGKMVEEEKVDVNDSEPAFEFSKTEAQRIMDDLYEAGVRPTLHFINAYGERSAGKPIPITEEDWRELQTICDRMKGSVKKNRRQQDRDWIYFGALNRSRIEQINNLIPDRKPTGKLKKKRRKS